jgi:hypothetical protein
MLHAKLNAWFIVAHTNHYPSHSPVGNDKSNGGISILIQKVQRWGSVCWHTEFNARLSILVDNAKLPGLY